jgi:hypothetical protein
MVMMIAIGLAVVQGVGFWAALRLVTPVRPPLPRAYPRVPREFHSGEWERLP